MGGRIPLGDKRKIFERKKTLENLAWPFRQVRNAIRKNGLTFYSTPWEPRNLPRPLYPHPKSLSPFDVFPVFQEITAYCKITLYSVVSYKLSSSGKWTVSLRKTNFKMSLMKEGIKYFDFILVFFQEGHGHYGDGYSDEICS